MMYRIVIKFHTGGFVAKRYEFESAEEADQWLTTVCRAIPRTQVERIEDVLIENCNQNDTRVA